MRPAGNETSAAGIMPLGFDFQDLRCYPNPANPHSYFFVPTTPDVQRDSNGHPVVTMFDAGASAYLMFTATWQASASSVEALRHEIATGHAAGHHEPDPGDIRLAFAPLSDLECHALLGDGTGSAQTVGTSATSGLPPYDALFNITVSPDRADFARRAANGEPGFLAIEYVGDLRIPSVASAAFRSESGELLPWLRDHRTSSASMRELLEEAIALGLATVKVDAPDHPGGEMAIELYDRVLSQAAQIAPRWIAEGAWGTLATDAAIQRDTREPIRAVADIGALIAKSSLRRS